MNEFFMALRGAYGEWISPETLDIGELGEGTHDYPGFRLTAVRTPHIGSSLAYRIESGGRSVVYSGDTNYSEALTGLSRNADLLIVECSIPEDSLKREGHLTPGEVIRTINESGVKRAVITHLYPACDDTKVVERIRSGTSAEVIGAEDLLTIEI